MIKAITFDLDGVYFLNGKENFLKNLGTRCGVAEDEARRVFLKSDQMNNLYKTGKWDDGEFWTWARSEWKISDEWTNLVEMMIGGYEVNDEVVKLIGKLKNKGYKILACSNNFPARVAGLDGRFGFLKNFEAAVFSYQVGSLKPEKEIFEVLVEKSGVGAEEIAYSDDDEGKLAGAKELGITTFVYQNFGQFMDELKNLGVKWE